MSRPVEHDDGPLLDIVARLHVWGLAASWEGAYRQALDHVRGPLTQVERDNVTQRLRQKRKARDAAVRRAQEAKAAAVAALAGGDISAALATGHAFASPAGIGAGPVLPSLLTAPTGTATRTPAAFAAALHALASDIEAGRVHAAAVQAELTALFGKAVQARRSGLEEPGS